MELSELFKDYAFWEALLKGLAISLLVGVFYEVRASLRLISRQLERLSEDVARIRKRIDP
jgi:hypothetical protein